MSRFIDNPLMNPIFFTPPRGNDMRMPLHKGGGSSGDNYYANQDKLLGTQADIAQNMYNTYAQLAPQYLNNSTQMVNESMNGSLGRQMREQAGAEATAATGAALDANNRNMQRYGMQFSGDKLLAEGNRNAILGAATKAGAMNQAATAAEDMKWNRNAGAYGQLAGMGTGAMSGTASAAAGYGNMANAMNSNQNAAAAGFGQFGGALAGALFRDGGQVRKKRNRFAVGGPVTMSPVNWQNQATGKFRGSRISAGDALSSVATPIAMKMGAEAMKPLMKSGWNAMKDGAAKGLKNVAEHFIGPDKAADAAAKVATDAVTDTAATKVAETATTAAESGLGNGITTALGEGITTNLTGGAGANIMTGAGTNALSGLTSGASSSGLLASPGAALSTGITAGTETALGTTLGSSLGTAAAAEGATVAGGPMGAAIGAAIGLGMMMADDFSDGGEAKKKAVKFGNGGLMDDFLKGPGAFTMHLAGKDTGDMNDAQKIASLAGDPIGAMFFAQGGEPKRRLDMRPGGRVDGPGTETSDSIPAWLSDEEFVANAEAVRLSRAETLALVDEWKRGRGGAKALLKKINDKGLEKRYGKKGHRSREIRARMKVGGLFNGGQLGIALGAGVQTFNQVRQQRAENARADQQLQMNQERQARETARSNLETENARLHQEAMQNVNNIQTGYDADQAFGRQVKDAGGVDAYIATRAFNGEELNSEREALTKRYEQATDPTALYNMQMRQAQELRKINPNAAMQFEDMATRRAAGRAMFALEGGDDATFAKFYGLFPNGDSPKRIYSDQDNVVFERHDGSRAEMPKQNVRRTLQSLYDPDAALAGRYSDERLALARERIPVPRPGGGPLSRTAGRRRRPEAASGTGWGMKTPRFSDGGQPDIPEGAGSPAGGWGQTFNNVKQQVSGLADRIGEFIGPAAEMYGSASKPPPFEVWEEVGLNLPVIGGPINAYRTAKSVKEGRYGDAALDALGFVPGGGAVTKAILAKGGLGLLGLGGVIKHVKAPVWNSKRKTFPMAEWDDGKLVMDEAIELLGDKQAKSAYDTLRTIKDTKTGALYAWPADAALHDDVGALLKLDPNFTKHGLIAP